MTVGFKDLPALDGRSYIPNAFSNQLLGRPSSCVSAPSQLRHRIDETPTSCAPIFPSLFSLCSHMKKYPFQLDVAF